MRVILDSVDSTNSFARRELATWPPDESTVISAREQTAGRGQFGRSWFSPGGQNVYLTVVEPLRPNMQLIHYSQAAALAVWGLLDSWGLAPEVKWPNDLFVGGKKIGGILVEGATRSGQPWAILGLGLNVNSDAEDLDDLRRPATSVRLVCGHMVDLSEFLDALTATVLDRLREASLCPGLCTDRYARACSWMVGTPITVRGEVGVVESVSGLGHLTVRVGGRSLVLHSSADCGSEEGRG